MFSDEEVSKTFETIQTERVLMGQAQQTQSEYYRSTAQSYLDFGDEFSAELGKALNWLEAAKYLELAANILLTEEANND